MSGLGESARVADGIGRAGRLFVVVWAFAVLLLYALGVYVGVRTLRDAPTAARPSNEPRTAAPAPDAASGDTDRVTVGVFVHRLGDFSARDGHLTADFDVWFRWNDTRIDPRIDPGATFQIVNGDVLERTLVASNVAGAVHYERYRVKARLTEFFDATRFPFGDLPLEIQVEDSRHTVETLRYAADERGSGVRRAGVPPVLDVVRSSATVERAAYATNRGDPRTAPDEPEAHSRFVFAMLATPRSVAIYLKNFQALFAAIGVALIVFFIRPTHVDPRFGLGVGAIFAAVTNNIMVADSLPPTGRVTLTTLVNGFGLATIFLTLVQSAISLYVLDELHRDRLRRVFDWVSFVSFFVGYVSLNVTLPLVAMG